MFASNTSQVSSDATYVEDVFSTYLYQGNGSTQTITNGIDLSGKGGLTWIKNRSDVKNNILVDTARGANNWIASNLTNAQASDATKVSSFLSTGFTVGSDSTVNLSTQLYASWAFRKQPKFFDVVTYTGDGASNRNISHSLGSTPGCVIVKSTDNATNWFVWHRSGTQTNESAARLNTTAAYTAGGNTYWGSPTSGTPSMTLTTFSVGDALNVSGFNYVAYVFAHNAGGFGLTGTDNVISCGSYTGNGSTSGPVVTLGYEPQWVLIKDATNASPDWWLFDNMRGVATGGVDMGLRPNTSGAEVTANDYLSFTATGFQPTATTNTVNQSGDTYIYIAIRRGPMKTPTSGTSVFSPSVRASGTGAAVSTTGVGFPPDLLISSERTTGVLFTKGWHDRLRGNVILRSDVTNNEAADSTGVTAYGQDGFSFGTDGGFATVNYSGSNYVYEAFRRAPGFFDEVCYTGTGSATTVAHNLGVAPELMIVKQRSAARDWVAYIAPMGNNYFASLNDPAFQGSSSTMWNDTTPTNTVFTVGTNLRTNVSGGTYVAYLFASCPGVSKVGSYTGNGSSQTINCGFTGGARFVMIKRTDSTGDWYVWDTARGIVSANDPRLSLNSTAAEVTTDDSIDPDNSGFIVNQVSATNINVSSATYIYLAIA